MTRKANKIGHSGAICTRSQRTRNPRFTCRAATSNPPQEGLMQHKTTKNKE